ncbi:MAG: sugar phosphate isomerase/epimerase family protein [Gemmata sp.]
MKITRRHFVATAATGLAAGRLAATDPPARANLGLLLYSYGIRANVEKDRGFADPVRFIEFAKSRGANAVQLALGTMVEADATTVRKAAERAGVHVEGIISPPADDRAGLERFAAEIATAKGCGAIVVRTVMLGGRRYETFDKPEDYPTFAKRAAEMLKRAEPVARKHGVKLAVENHKDFRTDEQVELLQGIASEFVGACVDTGNNLALLEAPAETVAALAPFALTVHLKDVAVEEAADGFRLAEVPLGHGILDLQAMVAALRKGNPKIRFQLEMITRDPLSIPCLGEKYWATLGRVPGRDLARTLALVRKSARKDALPSINGLGAKERLDAEEANVRASFAFAAKSGLLPAT